jgi:survival-of-motor-neuron-related-splicing factor 30
LRTTSLTRQLQQLETVLSGLQADPENAELLNLTTELEEVISLTESAIAELKPTPAPQQNKTLPPPVKEKWSKENHPAFQPGYKRPAGQQSPVEEPQTSTSFAVNDTVLAKWVSGDNSFYPARITSITGSTKSPVYTVNFKSYGTTENLSGKDIKAISQDSRKRKADGTPGGTAPPPPSNSNIISAAANINPDLASQARKESSKVSDGPTRPAKVPRKVKANKELEAGKSKWQDFAMKGKMGKVAKKDSMFRTPEGVNARGKCFVLETYSKATANLKLVGFTGSGQAMRKDPTRSRHIYQPGEEED